MLAMLMTKGTRYAKHIMLAMLAIIGTRYACHVDNREDQTCLRYQLNIK